ncbi:50S ribosomal protein L13 [candidate division KSB1 bacterium]|nr:MAG: 50S ribosomal protein L13 [candidate division KSB1 bacterium]
MQTYHAKSDNTERKWVIIDAADQVLGRLSTRVAAILRGKNKPEYTPHCDVGDFVIIVNASRVRLTGGKLTSKQYFSHTGHPGGKAWTSLETVMKTHPERTIERAVKGMMPRTRLGRKQLRKLKVYAGAEHPHEAQQPRPVQI